jgi:ABC-2 type transport system permease protein
VLVLLGAYKLFRMEAFPGARKRAKRDKVVVPEPSPAGPRPGPTPSPLPAARPELRPVRLADRVRDDDPPVLPRHRARAGVPGDHRDRHAVHDRTSRPSADRLYGTTIYPVTYAVIEVIEGFGLFFLILTAVYVAELMWRERGLKCDQIHDASPASDTATFASQDRQPAAGLRRPADPHADRRRRRPTRPSRATRTTSSTSTSAYLYGVTFPSLALIVLLAFFLQTLVNNKYLGISLIVLYYVLTLVLSVWGVDNRLARYDNAPTLTYSAMNGFGPNVGMYISLTAYYAAFAMVLLAIARLLLPRGTNSGWRARLRLARSRVTPAWFAFLVVSMAAWFGLGGYAYYNIHVLNTYRNTDASEALQAEYERTYKQYLTLPQPRIVAADVHVDLYPETRQGARQGQLHASSTATTWRSTWSTS